MIEDERGKGKRKGGREIVRSERVRKGVGREESKGEKEREREERKEVGRKLERKG